MSVCGCSFTPGKSKGFMPESKFWLWRGEVIIFHSNLWDTISYPLFADAETGIYPLAASQYHARPKAKRDIAMLSVDKFQGARPPPFFLLFPFSPLFHITSYFFHFFLLKPPINSSFLRNAKKEKVYF